MLDMTRSLPQRGRFKSVLAMTKINVESWRTSARTIVSVLIIIAVCFTDTRSFLHQMAGKGWTIYFGEAMFCALNTGCNLMMSSLLLLVTVMELPRRIPFQGYALVRAKRREWLAGQLLYCAGLAAFTLALVTVCTAIFSSGVMSAGAGWSDTARIAAGEIEEWDGLVRPFIREAFTPITACLYAALPVLCFWFTMLCIILLCSIHDAPKVGVGLYAFILWAGLIFDFSALPVYLPIYFGTLRDIGDYFGIENYWRIIAGYVVLDAALIAIMFLRVKRTDMVFDSENKF